jgi:hypothetical protein
MMWQCPNKCSPPIELPDGNAVTCGYCLSTTPGTNNEREFYSSKIGTLLKRRFKIASKVIDTLKLPCNCDSLIAQLNTMTPEQCRESFDSLLEAIIESGKKSSMPVGNPLAKKWIARQLRKAIEQAEQESQQLDKQQ